MYSQFFQSLKYIHKVCITDTVIRIDRMLHQRINKMISDFAAFFLC